MTLTLTNEQIYIYANSLVKEFSNEDIKFPIKINFYLQKNIKELTELAKDIEEQRISIAQEFGTLNSETNEFEIPNDKIQEATDKLNELFDLTQEVKIYKVKIDAFGDIDLTSAQMQALLFMIEDEEEE